MPKGNAFASKPNLASRLKATGAEQNGAFLLKSECCVLETCKGA